MYSMSLHASLDEERAHLVVQLAGLYISLHINCILHMDLGDAHALYTDGPQFVILHNVKLLDSSFLIAHNADYSSSIV